MNDKQHGYVDNQYLAAAADLFAPIKRRSYELMGALDGASVLDIGCGSGIDTVAMAALVGNNGRVIGVDFDHEMINSAKQFTESNNLSARVQHHCADACELPFETNRFSAVRSERLFMHLQSPETALAEAVRVTRPGGRIVLVDTDWGSLSAHTGADDIERRVARFRAESFIPNGYSGRRLCALMAQAQLNEVITETISLHTCDLALWRFLTLSNAVAELAVAQGVLKADEVEQWNRSMEACSERNAFFGSVNIVLACATVSG